MIFDLQINLGHEDISIWTRYHELAVLMSKHTHLRFGTLFLIPAETHGLY
jgi:hypothetical protein